MRLVGISGKAGVGKDYIYQHILKPKGFVNWSLAWHFKIWIVATNQATYEEVFVTKPAHVRQLLQLEGTERGRNVYGENVWCEAARAWIEHLNKEWGVDSIAIPDVRFPNEVRFIQQMGGHVLRIEAPERAANSSLTPEARLHPSETALDDFKGFDATVYNDPEVPEPALRWGVDKCFVRWGYLPDLPYAYEFKDPNGGNSSWMISRSEAA